MPETPAPSPEKCYVCGYGPHEPGTHTFWPESEAEAEFARQARMHGTYSKERAYIEQHRPY